VNVRISSACRESRDGEGGFISVISVPKSSVKNCKLRFFDVREYNECERGRVGRKRKRERKRKTVEHSAVVKVSQKVSHLLPSFSFMFLNFFLFLFLPPLFSRILVLSPLFFAHFLPFSLALTNEAKTHGRATDSQNISIFILIQESLNTRRVRHVTREDVLTDVRVWEGERERAKERERENKPHLPLHQRNNKDDVSN